MRIHGGGTPETCNREETSDVKCKRISHTIHLCIPLFLCSSLLLFLSRSASFFPVFNLSVNLSLDPPHTPPYPYPYHHTTTHALLSTTLNTPHHPPLRTTIAVVTTSVIAVRMRTRRPSPMATRTHPTLMIPQTRYPILRSSIRWSTMRDQS